MNRWFTTADENAATGGITGFVGAFSLEQSMKKGELKKIDREKAIDIFIQKIVRRGYLGSVRDTIELLSSGPTWPQPRGTHLEMHRWYSKLEASEKRLVNLIIEEAVYSAIFGVMNVLDGTTGTLIPDTNTHLLVTLQVYSTLHEFESDTPTVAIELNDLKSPIAEFHDKFQWAVKDLRGTSAG